MATEKKLTKSAAVSDEIKKSREMARAKTDLQTISSTDFEKLGQTITTIRRLFPQIDHYFTPAEILGTLGVDLGRVASCPSCLSCAACESCHSCQTCARCQECQSCNTCQKQAGHDTCPSEFPAVTSGLELVINPAERVKLELIQLVKVISDRVMVG